jgi:hypothetical protein
VYLFFPNVVAATLGWAAVRLLILHSANLALLLHAPQQTEVTELTDGRDIRSTRGKGDTCRAPLQAVTRLCFFLPTAYRVLPSVLPQPLVPSP